MKPTIEERFWARVDIQGPDDCWNWLGSRYPTGYGQALYYQGRTWRAHHMAMFFDGRPRIGDLHGLHSCDNKLCCNPAHLRWGTHTDNMQDRNIRKRTGWGTTRPIKFTPEVVAQILASKDTNKALAARLGLSSTRVTEIRNEHGILCGKGRRYA